MRAVFRSALVALSAFLLLGTSGFAQADDPFSRGLEADQQGDYAEAANWYRLAAEQGNAAAQYNLGMYYAVGKGVPPNYAESAKWIRLAALQGDAKAQVRLGGAYENGWGVLKNYAEAAKWYRLAAEQGHASAQVYLGMMYFRGEGVPEDYVQGYKWLNLAAAQGDADAARRRDGLRELLTPAQLAEAQKQSSTEMGRGREPERLPPAASGDVKATGSAFLVSGIGDVVTNAHVVSDCRRLTLADGTLLTLQAYEPASDLALLRTASLAGRPALPLRSGKGIRLADSVIVAGFPLTGIVSPDLNVTTGNVSALSGPDGNRALFQITAPVQSGNSGGPILDQAGNLVGVVVSKLDAVFVANLTGDLPQNVNFGISLGTLQTFLDANNVDYASQPATRELANASIAEAAKSATFQIVCY